MRVRISRASDDSAGQGVGTNLTAHISSLHVPIGLRGDAQDYISVSGHDMRIGTLGLSGFRPTDKSDLTQLDQVIDSLHQMRADVGATYNRLQSVQETINAGIQSISASLARVMDTDVAEETAKVSTNQVLLQAGASVMSNTYEFSKVALRILEK